jgi:hypothetical protein
VLSPDANVHFRYGEVQADSGRMGIIVLCYESDSSARETFSTIHRYITAGADVPRSFTIRLDKESRPDESYRLLIVIVVDQEIRRVDITGIDQQLVESLKTALSTTPYYMITAGYTESDQFRLLNPKEFNFFRGEILIDGESVRGASNPAFDPDVILDQLS